MAYNMLTVVCLRNALYVGQTKVKFYEIRSLAFHLIWFDIQQRWEEMQSLC